MLNINLDSTAQIPEKRVAHAIDKMERQSFPLYGTFTAYLVLLLLILS